MTAAQQDDQAPKNLRARSLPALLAVTALATLGMAPAAAASGTVTLSGTDLVYAGDDTSEQVTVNKETVADDRGTPVGFAYSVTDSQPGGDVTGVAPCGPREGFEAFCPFGSSLLQVSLGGGGDTFATEDDTVNPGDHRCRPAQDSAALRLDGGARDDLVRATPLADTIELGPGNDGVDSFGGDDTVNGGAGSRSHPDLRRQRRR